MHAGGSNSGSANAGSVASSVGESMARSKEAIGTAATEAMNSGTSDLQSVRADLNSLKDTVTTFMSRILPPRMRGFAARTAPLAMTASNPL
jgi:hypothetical protein